MVSCGAPTPIKVTQKIKTPSLKELTHLEIVFANPDIIPTIGAVSTNGTNTSYGSQMYPGYNGPSFIVSVIAHAVIQSAATTKAEKYRQTTANEVLAKYELLGDGFPLSNLALGDMPVYIEDRSINLTHTIPSKTNNIAGPLYAAVYPTLIMPMSEKSLILQNEVRIYSIFDAETPLRTATIEIVHSPDCGEIEAFEYWTTNNNENLNSTVQSMFSESIELALNSESIKSFAAGVQPETIRYLEDGNKKVERGQVLDQKDNRVRFITLRGAIKVAQLLEGFCIANL